MSDFAVALRGSVNRKSVFKKQILLLVLIASFFHLSLTTAQAGNVTINAVVDGDYVTIDATMGSGCGSLHIYTAGGYYRLDPPETEFHKQISVCAFPKGTNTFSASNDMGFCGGATTTADVSVTAGVNITEPSGIVQAPFDISGTSTVSGGWGLVDFWSSTDYLPSNYDRAPAPGGFSWNTTHPNWAPASNFFTRTGDHTVQVSNTACVGGNPGALVNARAETTFYVCNATDCGNTPPPDPELGNPGKRHGHGKSDGPDTDGPDTDGPDTGCSSNGWPQWVVNNVNMNLYIADTPIWYHPAIGPAVKFLLSYNSRSTVDPASPLGRKWQLSYNTSLMENPTTGAVAITLPDGRRDVYTQSGGAYIPPLGVFNTLTKIAANHFELSFMDGTSYAYQIPVGTALSHPVMTEIKDAHGQKLIMGYNAAGLLETVTDATGGTAALTYAGGLLQSIQDPFGRIALFGYSNGDLTSVQDMGGYQVYYEYETSPNDGEVYLKAVKNSQNEAYVFKVEPPDGTPNNTILYPNTDPAAGQKLGQNYRITITDPTGGKEEYYYMGPATWYISPRDYLPYTSASDNNLKKAAKTIYYLDRTIGKGRIKKITYPEGGYIKYENFDTVTGKAGKITHYHGLDSGGNPVTHSTQYTYNANGKTTSILDTRGKTTTYTYYPNNIDLQSITNLLGSISYTYNGSTHDKASITDRLGNITELTYNNYGQMTSITEAKNTPIQTITELLYDPASHNLTEVKKAGSTIATLTYDTIGRVQTQTDATGIPVTLEYNNLDKVTKVTFPDAKYIQINRSTLHPHLIDSVTDRGQQTTTYTHDALNRLTRISGPQGIYDYQYDKNGNMTKLIDSNRTPAVETVFEYNLDDQLKKKTYADGKNLSYTYDKAGLLTTTTNARNIATTFTYDQNHNLLKTDYADATPDVTNTYDDYNRLWTRTDGTGLSTYGYDNNGRLTSVDGPYSNDNITYQYDELDRITTLLPQTGQALSYVYDPLGRLKDIQAGTDTFTYNYIGASQLIQSLTRPNGSYTEYQYFDQPNQMKNLKAVINKKSTGDVINRFDYTYDARDLIATEAITNGQIIDNFITGTTTEMPNILNQIMSKTAQGQTKTYVYDNDGNMTTGFTPESYPITMTYDAQNRMTSAQYADGSSVTHRNEYNYAGNNLLAELRKYDAGVLTNTTKYLRAGFLPMQERDAANTVSREYTWGLNLGGGIGGLLNLKQDGADYSYLYDGKGNVSALVDSTQAVVASYAYDPFGQLMSKSGTLDQPYMFSTKEYDSRTGLNNYGYRSYDSCSGKWTTRDPLEEEGGINLYQAMGNNSENWIDPNGFEKHKITKPETHPGSKEHVHWGTDAKGRNRGAVCKDGSLRHGKNPPKKVVEIIEALTGWDLSNLYGIYPFFVLPGMPQAIHNIDNGLPTDFGAPEL